VVLGELYSVEIPYSGDDVSDVWTCVRSVLLGGGREWWWFLCEGMEWRFFIEVKSFLFSVKEDVVVVRLEERRKGFAGVVSLGLPCAVLLVATVEVALRNTGMKGLVKSFRKFQQVLIVRLGENKADRFLEMAVYAEGGRQRLILLPEGCDGRGWAWFAGELSKVVAFLEVMAAPSLSSYSFAVFPESGEKFGSKFPSYATVLRAEASTVVLLGPLAIEQAFDGDVCGNFFESQLGSNSRGMEECAVGVLASGEKLSDLGWQRFRFDAESEGVGCDVGKEKKLSPFWARRGKGEVELVVQRLLARLLELGFSCGGLSRKHRRSFGRHLGCSFQFKPKTRFLFKPNKPFSEVVLTGQGLMGPEPQPSAGSSLVLQTET
jgi:hypothetical protein